MGWFHPNDLGERLMPIICGTKPAFFALSELTRRLLPNPYADNKRRWDLNEVIKGSTEYADLAAANAQEAGLALELRGPKGHVIPTEDIGIQDTEFLRFLSFDEVSIYEVERGLREGGLDEDTLAEIEDFVAEFKENSRWVSEAEEEEEPDLPRYQIQVRLIDEADVPRLKRAIHQSPALVALLKRLVT